MQYQQTMDNPGGAAAGWFDFVSCCLEWSGTPLLDLQSAHSLAADIQGLEQVRITDYMNADNTAYTHYGTPGGAPVVSVNCSQRGCGIDGLSIDMAGYDTGVAVRVYAGSVTAATIAGSTAGVYEAHGVLDANGRTVGEYQMSTAAGFMSVAPEGVPALQVGVSGEALPRLSVGTGGSLSWSDVAAGDDEAAASAAPAPATVLERVQSNSSSWDPPPIAAGGVARTTVRLAAAAPGDVVAAAHTGAAADDSATQDLLLHAVAGPGNGTVTVLARNLGASTVDLPAGTLRVVLTKVA